MASRFVLAIGVLALAASCSRPAAEPASRPPPSGPVATSPTFTTAPDAPRELGFTAPRLGGGTVRGGAYAGQDLVIWFWAPW